MDKHKKVTPQKVKGKINLPGNPHIEINDQAVKNNGSKKTSIQFIESLKTGIGKGIFPDIVTQNGI